jgi:hypothetical protein
MPGRGRTRRRTVSVPRPIRQKMGSSSPEACGNDEPEVRMRLQAEEQADQPRQEQELRTEMHACKAAGTAQVKWSTRV